MNRQLLAPSKVSGLRWFHLWVSALALLLAGTAWGAPQDIDITCMPVPGTHTINATVGTPFSSVAIGTLNNPGVPVFWDFATVPAGAGCGGASPSFTCNGITMALPAGAPANSVPPAATVTVSGAPTAAGAFNFRLVATLDGGGGASCERNYDLLIASDGGNEGDPHLTTVDGIHYDFQSAGEFVALRGKDLEIQTRQTAIATTFLPGANPYTGLATCVSVNTAVAALVGSHRVSYQPNISGVPDPSGLELRIDGKLTQLGDGEVIQLDESGLNRPKGGRIVKSPVGGGIEIHFPNETTLIVTPGWWASQGKWYLNVNVYHTTANEGLMGQLAQRSWLPALPDGTSLGPQPAALHDRYIALYETFADAWRVTDATSLFDYAPGTSTTTFTLDSWPREAPSSCTIAAEPVAQPVDVQVAEKHCSTIADRNRQADCVFDVTVTGHTGFAETYLLTQQLRPGATKIAVQDDKDPTRYGESVTFTATVVPTVSRSGAGIPTGTVQFILDNSNVGSPLELDSNGRAVWTTSSLQVGKRQVVARYIPSQGGMFLASSSPEESHTVIERSSKFFWLVILLIIIILIAIVWWYRTR